MLLAILDFARIASALAVVVGVTSHLGSRAALSPRRCRIASAGARNRTEMLRLRGVLLTHNPSTSRIESEAALNPSGLEKKVHPHGQGACEHAVILYIELCGRSISA